ncbi:MAG: sugar transferase [Gaiellaceae bacterium]
MSRGWLVRRLLLAGDIFGLSAAYLFAALVSTHGGFESGIALVVFAVSLPRWVVAATLYGLYDRDEASADPSTLDDLPHIFLLMTLLSFVFAIVSGYSRGSIGQVLCFWVAGTVLIATGRAAARIFSRRTLSYVQHAVIVGAGDVGQLVARKLLQHPEYGINLVGFVDSDPKERQPALGHLTVLGSLDELPDIVEALNIQRVIVAFSRDEPQKTLQVVRSLRDQVHVDLVPRLFEVVGPSSEMHTFEALPILALPPVTLDPSSMLLKRAIDITAASLLLILSSPLFALFAWRIKRESPGPVFFRQSRLGMSQNTFTIVKFRTMRIDADDAPHREYIRATMEGRHAPSANGLHKLDRTNDVTRFGGWLRKTSLDELPQLVNVLRGDMSLVGPRPCLPYEVEHFSPHHFDRFLVPAGVTGLWQVSARAHSMFGEALDMDVLYARSWSLGLDLRLLAKTPLQLLRARATT